MEKDTKNLNGTRRLPRITSDLNTKLPIEWLKYMSRIRQRHTTQSGRVNSEENRVLRKPLKED